MRVTQQIDALEIMGVNSASYLILPKILGLITIMPFLVIFSSATGIIGAYGTAFIGHILSPEDLTEGLQHSFVPWFMYMSIIKSLFFAFIISSVSSFYGYTVEGGSVEVGKASTDAVVSSSVLILFSDGVSEAGRGVTTISGWPEEEMHDFMERNYSPDLPAQMMAAYFRPMM